MNRISKLGKFLQCDNPQDHLENTSKKLNGKGLQRSKKWLVRGLVKFATAVARLVCPDLLG